MRCEEQTFAISVESNCIFLNKFYQSLIEEIQEDYETCFRRSFHSHISSKANIFMSVCGRAICVPI